jgi:predicted restriction endonuclease
MNGEGRVNQAYLFELPTEVGDLYLALSNLRANDLGSDVLIDDASETMLLEAQAVLNDQTLTSTERQVLTSARIGQGLFKAQVGRIEPSCRLTGLSIPERLIASHMKPWKESTNDERLSAFNGLLMSPHVDHLFDRGLITFEETGAIVVSKELSPAVNVAWKLDFGMKGKPFTREQIPFLEYHQSEVFKS